MAYSIDTIEGIGPVNKEKLAAAGIKTTDALLKMCCDAKGRMGVSEQTAIGAAQLLKWANMADLMRISGVAKEYSELLEAAGVDTVKELRNRVPANLTTKMKEVNAQKKLTRQTPAGSLVEKWVTQAKELPPVITH